MRSLFILFILTVSSLGANAKVFEIGPYESDQLRVRVVIERALVQSCNSTVLTITGSENRGGYYNPFYRLYTQQSRGKFLCEYDFEYIIKVSSKDYILNVTPGVVLKVEAPTYVDRIEIDPII